MPDMEFIRAEIQRTRLQVLRHRYWITQLQRDGLPTTSAEVLLNKINGPLRRAQQTEKRAAAPP